VTAFVPFKHAHKSLVVSSDEIALLFNFLSEQWPKIDYVVSSYFIAWQHFYLLFEDQKLGYCLSFQAGQ